MQIRRRLQPLLTVTGTIDVADDDEMTVGRLPQINFSVHTAAGRYGRKKQVGRRNETSSTAID